VSLINERWGQVSLVAEVNPSAMLDGRDSLGRVTFTVHLAYVRPL